MSTATVIIVTKDRRDQLRDALVSALRQEGDVEVLVVDDGSSDGTAEMVRREFPAARIERFEESGGVVARRNQSAALASSPLIVSIDDDCVFTTPTVVAQTIADFDHPRIGAVAIPYVEVRRSPAVRQSPPDPDGRWAAPTFAGGAAGIRREVFLALGGFREAIHRQGEELDLALRMLDAGFVVRLGRADLIHHLESPHRNLYAIDVYGRRNEQLLLFTYFHFPIAGLLMAGYAARGLVHGIRVGRLGNQARGIALGLAACWRLRRERSPLSSQTLKLYRRLRRAGCLRLEAIESDLPPAEL